MPVLALLNDFLFQSKLQAAAVTAGVELRVVRQATEALAAAAGGEVLVLLDLHLDGALEAIYALRQALPQVAIVGFGSHVAADLLAQARAAGCTQVLPRSAFVQQLPLLLHGVQ